MLKVGHFYLMEGRIWRCGMTSDMRARLDPISGSATKALNGITEFTTYGASVNVSPNSELPEVSENQLSDEQYRRAVRLIGRDANSFVTVNKENQPMADVSQPVPAKKPAPAPVTVAQPTVSANKVANKERLAQLKQKAETKKVEKAAKPKVEKTIRPCVCGCGEQVSSYFAQGHDARFKGWMVKVERGEMKVEDLPPVVRKSFEFKKRGDGYVTTKNYKGETHTGYDKKKES